jgi:hypothetical protein
VFSGYRAGYYNTEGFGNLFSGAYAGYWNTVGSFNTFSGLNSGYFNSTGSANVFCGYSAGLSNTVESRNTMIGYYANFNPGPNPEISQVKNATAIGYKAYVSQSNSLVLGSIAGVNEAEDNVKVGIGTTAPAAPLHISRDDGTAQLLVKNTSTVPKAANMFELNNFGPVQFHMINQQTGVDWTFRNNFRKSFVIQAVGATIQFELNKDGDLAIAGDLSANGVAYSSDRNLKENFHSIEPQDTLEKLVTIPISKWNFKGDDTTHIGPMAQDFYSAFKVGKNERHLNPADTAGVTMAAIQGLYQKLQEKDREIETLRNQMAQLEALVLSMKDSGSGDDD